MNISGLEKLLTAYLMPVAKAGVTAGATTAAAALVLPQLQVRPYEAGVASVLGVLFADFASEYYGLNPIEQTGLSGALTLAIYAGFQNSGVAINERSLMLAALFTGTAYAGKMLYYNVIDKQH